MATAAAPIPASPTPITGILTPDQASPVLGVTPRGVKRSISTRQLKATRLELKQGQAPSLRIASADLDAFVRNGAKGLQEPHESADGWIDEPAPRYLSESLEQKLIEFSEWQRVTDEKLAELCKRSPFATKFDVELTFSPQMRAVFDGPPERPRMPKEKPSPFATWGELWCVLKLLSAARNALDVVTKQAGPVPFAKPIDRFYCGDPDLFDAVVSRAVQATAQRYLIVWSESRTKPNDDKMLQPETVRVSYGLRVSAATSERELKRIAEIVF